ncbi:MAG: cadherin-like domain-containing protein, partial [Acidobacteria bacterium]|nr:cadherin-like domain-containing protein [Acidobacteriota bacterium]
MNHRTSLLCRRNLRAYAAAFISYLMLAGQVAPLALAAAAPRAAAAPVSAATSAPRPAPASEAVAPANAARPEPAPLPFFAPTITATKVDAWDDTATPDGKAEPGQVVTYTVTITNTGPDPATGVQFSDAGDTNTSLVPGSVQTQPVAQADTASAFGNVRITTAQGAPNLLANDCDPDDITGPCNDNLTASGPTTSTNNGNVVVNADGTFEYNPFPGFTGSDTFTYTVRDKGPNGTANDADDKTDTAVMTITVGPTLVWFIDNQAAGGGDGRLTSPFNSIAAFNAGAADDPGDIIFLFTGTGTYTGGFTLLNTQKLIGQGFLLSTETGAAPAGSDALPGLGSAPTIDNAGANIITLGQNNTLRGFNTGNSGTTGSDISGTSFGTLTVSALSINGDGRALNLTTGTLAATVANLSASNTGTLAGLVLNAVGGALTVSGATNITNPGGTGINITNSPAGHSFSFGATTVNKNATGGTGVNLGSNLGTTTFLSLAVTTQFGIPLNISSGGTVNVTNAAGSSLTSTQQSQGLVVISTAVAMNFTSISVVNPHNNTTSAALRGIDLQGVTGTGIAVGTTTVTNSGPGFPSLEGIFVQNCSAPFNFGNTTLSTLQDSAARLDNNSGNITFADLDITLSNNDRGLHATDNTGTITATSGTISTSGGGNASAVLIDGPAGRTPINLTFDSVTTAGVGSGSASISIVDASGTKFQVTGTTQINTRSGRGVFVDNVTATTVQFNAVNIPNPSNAGGNAFHVEDSSSAVTVATVDIDDPFITSAQQDADTNFFPDTDGDGDGIFLRSNTGLFTLSGGTISNPGNDGIDARSTRIAITGVTITNPGQDVTGATGQGFGGHGIAAINLTGANTITTTTISGFNVANRSGLVVNSNTGTATLAVTSSTFQNSTGNAGVVGTTSGTANLTLTIGQAGAGCTFTNISASAVITTAADTSVLNATVQNSTFQTSPTDGKTNVTGGTSQSGTGNFTIINNTFTNVFRTASTGEALISFVGLNSGGTNTFGMNISGNTISGVGLNSTACSGGVTYCAGPLEAILVFVDDNTDVNGTIQINNNVITSVQQGGILLDMANDQGGNIDAKITGNTVGTDAAPVGTGGNSVTNQFGINVQRRRLGAETANVLISNNSIRNGSAPFTNGLNGNGIWARGQADTNLSVTITNNNINTLTGGAGPFDIRIDANTVAVGDPDLAVVCADINSNTIAATGFIDLNESSTGDTLNIEQASAAAVAAANSGATVTADAGVAFGVACATPPAGPVSGGGSDAFMGAAMAEVPVVVSNEEKPKSAFGGGVTDRPFIGMPRTAPKPAEQTLVAPQTGDARKADAAAAGTNAQSGNTDTTTTAEQSAPVTAREGADKRASRTQVQSDDP